FTSIATESNADGRATEKHLVGQTIGKPGEGSSHVAHTHHHGTDGSRVDLHRVCRLRRYGRRRGRRPSENPTFLRGSDRKLDLPADGEEGARSKPRQVLPA